MPLAGQGRRQRGGALLDAGQRGRAVDRAQRDQLALAQADQRAAGGRAQVGAGRVEGVAQDRALGVGLLGVRHDDRVVVVQRHAQGAGAAAGGVGVAAAADDRLEHVAAEHLAVAPDALGLVEVGLGDRGRHERDVAHHLPGGLDGGVQLVGVVVARAGERRPPDLLAEQPERLLQGVQRDPLVHAAGGALAGGVELLGAQHDAALEVVDEHAQVLAREVEDLAVQEVVVDGGVVDDLVAIAPDRGQRDVVDLLADALGDGRERRAVGSEQGLLQAIGLPGRHAAGRYLRLGGDAPQAPRRAGGPGRELPPRPRRCPSRRRRPARGRAVRPGGVRRRRRRAPGAGGRALRRRWRGGGDGGS